MKELDVIGIIKLDAFKKKHPQARGALDTWLAVAKEASWRNLNDIHDVFPKASQIGKSDFIIFDIKGNDYRLAVKAKFTRNLLMIDGVYTHAEYDKQNFKGKG
ncbi:MAG: type II toxin-antitoxin system HigB family toxin [Thiotrichales bacterium]|nr:type II toxin-antitoxin system HigB family toxin [Thiotrichales bacterium]